MQKLLSKTKAAAGHRAHKPVEMFQIMYKADIDAELARRGSGDMNEAARKARRENDDDNETLEEQDGHVKMSRGQRMSLRNDVVADLWAELSDEDREAVEREVETEKKRLAREQLEEEEKRAGNVKTPKDYQRQVSPPQLGNDLLIW